MPDEYRDSIRKKIESIQNEIDILANDYRDNARKYANEVAEIEKRCLKGKIEIEKLPFMADQWKGWFYTLSSKRGEQMGEVFTEIADLIVTADTPEKKDILYEELDRVWKLKKN